MPERGGGAHLEEQMETTLCSLLIIIIYPMCRQNDNAMICQNIDEGWHWGLGPSKMNNIWANSLFILFGEQSIHYSPQWIKGQQDLEVLEGDPGTSKSSRCCGAFYLFLFLVLSANGLFQCFKFQSHSFKIFKLTLLTLFNPTSTKWGLIF